LVRRSVFKLDRSGSVDGRASMRLWLASRYVRFVKLPTSSLSARRLLWCTER